MGEIMKGKVKEGRRNKVRERQRERENEGGGSREERWNNWEKWMK